MDSEEKDIFDYLKSWGRQFVSARQICRRAGGQKKWDKSPHWAIPFLNAMVYKNILETDSMAHFRIRPDEKKKKRERWLSPEVAKILKERGLDAEKPHDDRIRPDEKTEKRERWLSPEVAKILKERGLDAEKPHDIADESDGPGGHKSPQ